MKEFFREGPGRDKKDVDNKEGQWKHSPILINHALDLCPDVSHLHSDVTMPGLCRQVVHPPPRDKGGLGTSPLRPHGFHPQNKPASPFLLRSQGLFLTMAPSQMPDFTEFLQLGTCHSASLTVIIVLHGLGASPLLSSSIFLTDASTTGG